MQLQVMQANLPRTSTRTIPSIHYSQTTPKITFRYTVVIMKRSWEESLADKCLHPSSSKKQHKDALKSSNESVPPVISNNTSDSTAVQTDPTEGYSPYLESPLDLESEGFRLVELIPLGLPWPGAVQCRLHSYSSPSECPPYTALSYQWDHQARKGLVELNGAPIYVGCNLWVFLDRMRRRRQHGPYWIDALCIDQANTEERSHQVQQMQKIYSNASSVSVWLGETEKGSNLNIALEYMGTSGNNEWCTERDDALYAFANHGYWRRIWIVQEIALAKRVVVCGGSQITCSPLLNRSIFVDVRDTVDPNDPTRTIDPSIAPSELNAQPGGQVLDIARDAGKKSRTLKELMYMLRESNATDFRDTVFALLGLASDGDQITVDYRVSPEDLYTQVIKTSGYKDEIGNLDWYVADHLGVDYSGNHHKHQSMKHE